jgi:hypothetical protein
MTDPRSAEVSDQSFSTVNETINGSIARRSGPLRGNLHRVFRSLTPVLVGVLLGAVTGFVIGAVTVPRPVAIARIEVAPDPPLDGAPSTPDLDRFIQTEVLVLSGGDLSNTVSRRLELKDPLDVTATQVGPTDIVELQVHASTETQAVKAAGALIDTYRRQRADSLGARVQSALDVVRRQLTGLRQVTQGSRSDAEYTRLLGSRNDLQLIRDSEQGHVTTVLKPRAVKQTGLGRALRFELIGAVLGALLGLVIVLLRGKYSVSEDAGVAELGHGRRE